jgi:hypothetical protein
VPDVIRLFEGKALAAALRDSGWDVSTRTVQRWTSGEIKPRPQDLAAVRRLVVGELGETKEAAPPEWARRLMVGTLALERKQGVTNVELAAAEAEADALIDRQLGAAGMQPQLGGGAASRAARD